MLRFHLPPNLVAAAARNAVPLRVECDLTGGLDPALLPALALLQRWCGTNQPPKFIQLTRAQLRELATAAGALPLFVENGAATTWSRPELLAEPAAATPPALVAPAPTLPGAQRKAKPGVPAAVTVDGSEHYLALTLPSPEHPHYPGLLALVKQYGFLLELSNRKWWLRDRHKTLTFLAAHLAELRDTFGAQFTPNFQRNTAHIRPAELTAAVAPAGAAFAVTLGVQASAVDEPALRDALAASRAYYEAADGLVLLVPEKLARLAAAQRALAGDPAASLAPRSSLRIPATRAAEAQEILEALSPNFAPPAEWRERSRALRQLTTLEPAPLPAPLAAQLRPYQRLGVAWLWHLRRHQLGGILADEMGLGKTLQALALLSAHCAEGKEPSVKSNEAAAVPAAGGATSALALSSSNSRGASLVICPASLLENWRREAARFAPQLRVFVHHGDRRLAGAADFRAHDLVITSYGTLAHDQALFATLEFPVLVADEAQHLKNRHSQNAAALRALRARARFLLTGTPLENSLDDLRSLFEVLLPGFLPPVPVGSRGEERAWYDERLRAQTAPYILRRTKQIVAPELPPKLEQILWCELTPSQAALYHQTRTRFERELLDLAATGATETKLRFAALTQLLRLRQICCDPRLVAADLPSVGAALLHDAGAASPRNVGAASRRDQGEPADTRDARLLPSEPVADSAKLDAFNELLAEAIDDGHRVLVFSQFTSLLALLRLELEAQQLTYCYLDGSMPAMARQLEVDRFQSSPEIPIFLLSLKAGGTGLNLTGADVVVHFDPWWNPAVEAQATDRAHRIGQRRVVTSHKLITTGTVEEKVLALQAEKRALLAGVFEASEAAVARLSLADLQSLLA